MSFFRLWRDRLSESNRGSNQLRVHFIRRERNLRIRRLHHFSVAQFLERALVERNSKFGVDRTFSSRSHQGYFTDALTLLSSA